MAIGHNFGCESYRKKIEPLGREDDQATWRNLDSLLIRAGCEPARCFRTNWFIGLLPGNKQTGPFLREPDQDYEKACLSLLTKQIKHIRPMVVLLLGSEVAGRAHLLMPGLAPWRDAKRWADVDQSSIGYSIRQVDVPGANVRTNVAALLHPSFGSANEARRMRNMRTPATQVEIINSVLV